MKTAIHLTLIIILISSCSQTNNISPDKLAENACNCFSELESGTIDERLTPCLSNPVNENQERIQETFYPDLSMQEALKKHIMNTTLIMIHSCDSYYNELDQMFTNMYPEVLYSEVSSEIISLQDSISQLQDKDSIKLSLMHKKIALLTKARKLDEALLEAEMISGEFSLSETYLIKTYIFRLQGKYELALDEVNRAINAGNTDYSIFGELIKRKKNDR